MARSRFSCLSPSCKPLYSTPSSYCLSAASRFCTGFSIMRHAPLRFQHFQQIHHDDFPERSSLRLPACHDKVAATCHSERSEESEVGHAARLVRPDASLPLSMTCQGHLFTACHTQYASCDRQRGRI